MAQIFPRWTNRLPLFLIVAFVLLVVCSVGFFWYFGSPEYTDVGYRPKQPVSYSHKLHAGDLGLDCRYCHYAVELSPEANIPPTQVCMNCHKLIGTESEKLLPVRESWASGKPIEWVRVHKTPDFAYFDHSIHLSAGIGCVDCHGNVARMEVVQQSKPLSMSWCLDCHKAPEKYLRPPEEITNMQWQPPDDQKEFAHRVMAEKNIAAPVDCWGCHR